MMKSLIVRPVVAKFDFDIYVLLKRVHVFVLQKAYCAHCSDRIWGLGSQGYKCITCKLLVHKRCHRLIPQTCQRLMVSM